MPAQRTQTPTPSSSCNKCRIRHRRIVYSLLYRGNGHLCCGYPLRHRENLLLAYHAWSRIRANTQGGALTLNAISGIGMLAVGTLGFPYIGALQAGNQIDAITENEAIIAQAPSLKDGNFTTSKSIYEVIKYDAVDDGLLATRLSEDIQDQKVLESVNGEIKKAKAASAQGALADMTVFPIIMLVSYLVLMFYFKNRGGYKPIEL